MERRKIVVTGGAGFIGSHLCYNLLLDKKNEIICIDNFDNFYCPEIKKTNIEGIIKNERFRLLKIDIRNFLELESVIGNDIFAIIHLAAKAGVRPSINDPLIFSDYNIIGTQNILELAKRKNIKKIVFASSSSVYGINPNTPWSEDDNVLMPISPYAATKVSSELLGHVYSSLYDINFTVLRFFTVYGPRQRPDLAIHKFFNAIYLGEPITVYGNGDSSRDYTFIDDVINGIIASLSYTSTPYEIFNIGNSSPILLKELIELIEDVVQKKAIINYVSDQQGDVPKTFADINKAKNILKYNPEMPIKEGLIEFNKWFREFQK